MCRRDCIGKGLGSARVSVGSVGTLISSAGSSCGFVIERGRRGISVFS